MDNRQRGGQKDDLVMQKKVNGWTDRLIDRHKVKQIDELNNSSISRKGETKKVEDHTITWF